MSHYNMNQKLLFLSLLPFSMASAGLIANAQIDGFGTTQITGKALVEYLYSVVDPPPPNPTLVAADAVGYTQGPVRPGFMEVIGGGSGDFGYGAASISGFRFSCDQAGCQPNISGRTITLPFTLGTTFPIHTEAFAYPSPQGYGSRGSVGFFLSLFESLSPGPGLPAVPGNKVTIYDRPTEMPEPSTGSFLGVALVLLGLLAVGKIAH